LLQAKPLQALRCGKAWVITSGHAEFQNGDFAIGTFLVYNIPKFVAILAQHHRLKPS
jgi:hypothetical protein